MHAAQSPKRPTRAPRLFERSHSLIKLSHLPNTPRTLLAQVQIEASPSDSTEDVSPQSTPPSTPPSIKEARENKLMSVKRRLPNSFRSDPS